LRDERVEFVDGVLEVGVVGVVGADVDENDIGVSISRQPAGKILVDAVGRAGFEMRQPLWALMVNFRAEPCGGSYRKAEPTKSTL
jgi:hypothetical protein